MSGRQPTSAHGSGPGGRRPQLRAAVRLLAGAERAAGSGRAAPVPRPRTAIRRVPAVRRARPLRARLRTAIRRGRVESRGRRRPRAGRRPGTPQGPGGGRSASGCARVRLPAGAGWCARDSAARRAAGSGRSGTPPAAPSRPTPVTSPTPRPARRSPSEGRAGWGERPRLRRVRRECRARGPGARLRSPGPVLRVPRRAATCRRSSSRSSARRARGACGGRRAPGAPAGAWRLRGSPVRPAPGAPGTPGGVHHAATMLSGAGWRGPRRRPAARRVRRVAGAPGAAGLPWRARARRVTPPGVRPPGAVHHAGDRAPGPRRRGPGGAPPLPRGPRHASGCAPSPLPGSRSGGQPMPRQPGRPLVSRPRRTAIRSAAGSRPSGPGIRPCCAIGRRMVPSSS